MVTSEIELPDGVKMVNDPYQGAAGTGMVVLATAHKQCLELDWGRIRDIVSEAKLFDGPRSLDRDLMESVGFEYRWEFQMSRFLKSIRAILPHSSNKAEVLLVYFRTYDAKGQILVKSIPSIKKQNYFPKKDLSLC